MAPCAPIWPDKLRFGRAEAFIPIAIRLDRGRRAAWPAVQPGGAA